MADLSSTYMGIPLASPLVASASPLTGKLDSLRQLEDSGAAAVVLPSVFEEQLLREKEFMDHFLSIRADTLTEAQSFFPDPDLYEADTSRMLNLVSDAKSALNIPVIASLNGTTREGWTSFATSMQDAGADALELNIYEVAADPDLDSSGIEERQLEVVQEISNSLTIPVAVKLSSHYSAFAHFAKQMEESGANALVLFNRFYQPDFDIEQRTASRKLGLSNSREALLPLSWIAILRGQRSLDLAATTGVHTATDVIKYLMAGANVVCTTSSLLKNGPGHLATLREGLTEWLDQHDYDSVDQLRGCMQRTHTENPELFERANYIKLLSTADWD